MHRAATKKTSPKIVYLMRGAPASGKSFAAKKLAGAAGVVCETDAYFGLPGKNYHFVLRQRPEARASNMRKFLWALQEGFAPIVVDRGCGEGRRTWWYAKTAQIFGYTVKLAEPTSPWWKKIKKALMRLYEDSWTEQYFTDPEFQKWAAFLFEKQKFTHRVCLKKIKESLKRYDPILTIKDILREGK